MKTITTIAVVAATITTVAFGANAYAKRDGGHHGDRMISRISEKLDLNDTQSQALQALQAEVLETRELMKGGGESMKTQMMQLMDADTFDQGAALSLINERAEAFQANAPELVATAGVFIDSLNPEQKASVREFMEKGGKRRFGGKRHQRNQQSVDE